MTFKMRTCIAIGVVLALGVTMAMSTTAGAQISDSGSAAQVQYPDLRTNDEPQAPVAAQAPTEPAADDDLPVTGFVAIPLLVTGGVLLLVGGALHLRTRRD
jgi:hypothetical protein